MLRYELFMVKDSQVLHHSNDLINWCLNNEHQFEVLDLGIRQVETVEERNDSQKQGTSGTEQLQNLRLQLERDQIDLQETIQRVGRQRAELAERHFYALQLAKKLVQSNMDLTSIQSLVNQPDTLFQNGSNSHKYCGNDRQNSIEQTAIVPNHAYTVQRAINYVTEDQKVAVQHIAKKFIPTSQLPTATVFRETLTPHSEEFTDLINHLCLASFDDKSKVNESFLRDYIVSRVKKIALGKGFKIKMPYADRLDKNKTRTINFYCHMSKSANRKLGSEQKGCQFRVIYKMRSIDSQNCIDENANLFELYRLQPMHSHQLTL